MIKRDWTVKSDDVEKTKMDVASGKEEAIKVMQERDEMIQELVEKTQLHQNEKDLFLQQLKNKEEELIESRNKLSRLNESLESVEGKMDVDEDLFTSSSFRDYTIRQVINDIGAENIVNRLTSDIRRKFSKIADSLHREYLKDLQRMGCYDFDSGLTVTGAKFFRELARKVINDEKR